MPEPSSASVESRLHALHVQVRGCLACPLHRTRINAVPGSGNPNARLMIVGEAPGQHEDQQGVPFVGAAGQLLTKLLNSVGLAREEAFITNIVKCRPPANRDPVPEEVAACSGYLDAQVDLLQPAVILLLGRHAVARLLPGMEGISKIHGQVVERDGRSYVPLYHPAAALYNGFLVDTLKADFIKVRQYIDAVEARRLAESTPIPAAEGGGEEQLALFTA